MSASRERASSLESRASMTNYDHDYDHEYDNEYDNEYDDEHD